MTNTKVSYTSQDAGCYVDSARGIYAVDAIVSFAENHGFTWKEDRGEFQVSICSCRTTDDLSALNHEKPSDCEFSNEIEDEATEYMNDNFPVLVCVHPKHDTPCNALCNACKSECGEEFIKVGAYWGRNENGDWGLWVVDEE